MPDEILWLMWYFVASELKVLQIWHYPISITQQEKSKFGNSKVANKQERIMNIYWKCMKMFWKLGLKGCTASTKHMNRGVRYPIWFNSIFEFCQKNHSFNIWFNIALPKIQFKILFNSLVRESLILVEYE